MLARVSDALNRAVLGSHHRGLFLRDPKRVVMLRDAWYSGRADSSGLAAALTKARVCLRALESSAVWDDLEQCQPEWITVPDGPEAFVHEGWPIYAGPDLVYRPDGRKVVILDWKTGDDSDAELQIPLYALYCRTVLGLPFRDEEWFGRVVNLCHRRGHHPGDHPHRRDGCRGPRPRQRGRHALAAGRRGREPAAADGGVPDPGAGAAARVPLLPVPRALRAGTGRGAVRGVTPPRQPPTFAGSAKNSGAGVTAVETGTSRAQGFSARVSTADNRVCSGRALSTPLTVFPGCPLPPQPPAPAPRTGAGFARGRPALPACPLRLPFAAACARKRA